MSLTPWNRQEEWYQQMINASTGNYLPSITAQDEGKVLTVESDGSWGVENVPSELPEVTASDKDKFLHTDASTGNLEWSAVSEVPTVGSSDKGKYLHSDESTGNVEWADAPTELPSVSGTDEGKVLTVNDSGVWVAQTPASGGGVLVVNVNFTYDDVEETWSFTTDKTFSEIVYADTAGQKLLALCKDADGRVGTPSWMSVSHEDDYTFVIGVTDMPAGSTGMYDELTFILDANEPTVEAYRWIKTSNEE